MFDLQQRYGIENLDKDGSLHEQMYLMSWWVLIISCEQASKYYMAKWLW